MLSLEKIKKPIEKEMGLFENKFRDSMKSTVPLLDRITHYIIKRKGKQIRPMFVFFSAGTCGGITESTYHAASLIELLHTATLVHDDVVDDSSQRRGFFSVNALWKNKIAVLVGDYLLSRGLILSVNHNEFNLLKIVTRAVKDMSEGELLQIEKARKLDIEEPVYFEIIRQKTASLIASCCACGAASSGAQNGTVEKMHRLGEIIGMCFQIKDDLLDFDVKGNTGKPLGGDLKNKKMTLPLIYTLGISDKKQKRKLINIVKNHSEVEEKTNEVLLAIRKSGGINYAEKKMLALKQEAFTIIDEFPENEYRNGLKQLIDFTIDRMN